MKKSKPVEIPEPKIFRCGCGTHMIAVEFDDETNEMYMSFWNYGTGDENRYNWKFVLRSIWHTLRYGHPYTDEIVLNRTQQKKLGKILVEGKKK